MPVALVGGLATRDNFDLSERRGSYLNRDRKRPAELLLVFPYTLELAKHCVIDYHGDPLVILIYHI